ncbi:unnamed protein product, partial [Owenia fusiformis]
CTLQSTPGSLHSSWANSHLNHHDTLRATVKARLMTGTYILQSNRAALNQYRVDPTSQLCLISSETPAHFVTNCPALSKTRAKHLQTLEHIIPSPLFIAITQDNDTLTHITIDPTYTISTPRYPSQ